MRWTEILFTGGEPPNSLSQWVVFCLTAAFALFILSFITLLALSLLFAVISLCESIMVWSI